MQPERRLYGANETFEVKCDMNIYGYDFYTGTIRKTVYEVEVRGRTYKNLGNSYPSKFSKADIGRTIGQFHDIVYLEEDNIKKAAELLLDAQKKLLKDCLIRAGEIEKKAEYLRGIVNE